MVLDKGFPKAMRYIPVPASVLGGLLQDIHSIAELKCTLRILGLVYQRRGRRLWVSKAELLADSVLVSTLKGEPGGAEDAIARGLTLALERGTLLQSQQQQGDHSQTILFVNDEPGRHALENVGPIAGRSETQELPDTFATTGSVPNIFSLYEENIGALTPLLAEDLKEAEALYPAQWIQEAFRQSVRLNHRSWRYIARILERWATEGKDNGKPERHSQTTDRKEYLRRYGHLAR